MKKRNLFISLLAISSLSIGLVSRLSWAQENSDPGNLEKRIEALEALVRPPELTEADRAPEKKPLLFETLQEKKFLEGIEIIPGVVLSGLLEVEADYETLKKAEGGHEHNSDIKLATFELGVDIDAIKYVHAHALLLWEEDDTEPIDLDEGIITLGRSRSCPWGLRWRSKP